MSVQKKINDVWLLKGLRFENRLGFAPIGPSVKSCENGMLTQASVDLFAKIAENGPSLLIHGSTSISREYRASGTQCGIWSDEHIEGLRREVEAVHARGRNVFMQLEHPGVRSNAEDPPCSSNLAFSDRGTAKHGHAMTPEEIELVILEYAEGAQRAVAAGYDGLEIHASHGWLLSTFLNKNINKRTDEYGQEPTFMVRRVLEAIKAVVPVDYPVGIRMSAYVPTLEEGLRQAKLFEEMGFDFLDVSVNYKITWLEQDNAVPTGYPFNPMIYAASEIKKQVSIPVFAAKGVNTREKAEAVLENTHVDLILVGRAMLADPHWAAKVLAGEKPISCFACKNCNWRLEDSRCPALLIHGGVTEKSEMKSNDRSG